MGIDFEALPFTKKPSLRQLPGAGHPQSMKAKTMRAGSQRAVGRDPKAGQKSAAERGFNIRNNKVVIRRDLEEAKTQEVS